MTASKDTFLEPSATGQGAYDTTYELSPDGSVRVTCDHYERRNNEWWAVPRVDWEGKSRAILRIPENFEGRVAWTGPRNLALFTGEAFGRATMRVDVDVGAGRGVIAETGREFALEHAQIELQKAYRRVVAALPPPPPPVPPDSAPAVSHATLALQHRAPTNWKAVIGGLLIGCAIVAAIALGSFLWNEQNPSEPPYPIATPMKPVKI